MLFRFLATAAILLTPVALGAEEAHVITPVIPDHFDAIVYEDGRILCAWLTGDRSGPQTQIMAAHYAPEYDKWFGPKPLIRDGESVSDLILHYDPTAETLWLFTVEASANNASALQSRQSQRGVQWSAPETLFEAEGPIHLGSAAQDEHVIKIGFSAPARDARKPFVATSHSGAWTTDPMPLDTTSSSAPVLVHDPAQGFLAYALVDELPHRYLRTFLQQEPNPWEASNLPHADATTLPAAAVLSDNERLLTLARLDVVRPGRIALAASYDGGRSWPIRRTVAEDGAGLSAPRLLPAGEDGFHLLYAIKEKGLLHQTVDRTWLNAPMTLSDPPTLATVAPPLDYDGHFNRSGTPQIPLPAPDTQFFEQVRQQATLADWNAATQPVIPESHDGIDATPTTPIVQQGELEWLGTEDGLFSRIEPDGWQRHPHYGFDGPLANRITGLAVDDEQLWVATPGGLSVRGADGTWRLIRGQEGLPWPELTALAIDSLGRIWLGSTRGLIIHDPANEARPWYYRQGERYLPGDHIEALIVAEDGRSALIKTNAGIGRLIEEAITLHDKAAFLEAKYNERHRRLGLSSPAFYEDPYSRDAWTHGPQPSDGLWTSYHVTATALAYSLTRDEAYRRSAAESMEAMYLLQNVTGIPGLVARTVVSVDEPAAEQFRDADNYHLTADGQYLWRDDVSSDQLDGHFLAFYTWFEHIAQFDPKERARAEEQIRLVLDFILDNNDTIPDWSGERTMWGWWTPELLNEAPIHFQEVGIYSLMMLSFLKVAYYITEDERYADRYRELIEEHDFLSNVLLEKKLFPDELNHSDDQLSAVAYYPILQLEHDPFIRDGLHRSIRRHAKVEVPERNSFFALVYATIDPADADIEGAIRTLREMPRDRRNWAQHNSHRHDIALWPGANRNAKPVLVEVLPYDEHHFERWNQDPYVPDSTGDGRLDGSGEHFLIPYWIGRYHQLIAAP